MDDFFYQIRKDQTGKNLISYVLGLSLMTVFALWVKSIDIGSSWQGAGLINFSLGFVLLAAYMVAQILRMVRIPLISAYIFTGIVAGPYVTGFLTFDMAGQLRLIDDLALSFIALTAGGGTASAISQKTRTGHWAEYPSEHSDCFRTGVCFCDFHGKTI